jgi:hypothetical protein
VSRGRRRPPVSEEQRIRAVQAIDRKTMAAREVWAILGVRFPEVERWLASAVSHGYLRMRRTGNVRLYSARPAAEPWLTRPNLRPSTVPPAITVHMAIPGNIAQSTIRAMMADVIDEALSVRGWTVEP